MARKKSPSLPLYRNIAVSFSALTVLLIAAILYFATARAIIVVTPRLQTVPLTTTLTVVREPKEGTSALVGTVVRREVTKKETFSTSVAREEDGKASGKVRIVNTTGSAQTLVATTRFLTPGKLLFRLKDTVVVPARGNVLGTIVADASGVSGDVAPTRWTIPGLREELQTKIYGESDAAMTGGRRAVHRLSQNDIDNARAALGKKIDDEVRAEIVVGGDDRPFVLLTATPTASVIDQKLGAETKEFSLTLTERVEGVAVAEKAFHGWLTAQLKTLLPDDQRLLPISLERTTARIVTLDPNEGSARLLVKAEGQSLLRSTSPALDRTRFVGRAPEEVTTLLRQHGGVKEVRVELSPFFLRRLPRLPDHIRVEIKE